MKRAMTRLSMLTPALLMAMLLMSSSALAMTPDDIRLSSGARWSGEVNDQIEVTFVEQGIDITYTGVMDKIEAGKGYIIMRGQIAGKEKRKLIYIADIKRLRTLAAADASSTEKASDDRGASAELVRNTTKLGDASDAAKGPGVFFMEMKGPVGSRIRAKDIEELIKHADSFGPGQIIVLQVTSNGGLVFESDKISEAIHDGKQRHRIIAWVHKAISAGASLAMACDEIYFMTEGIAGSVTTVMGQTDASTAAGTEGMVQLALKGGYSEHIARAMKESRYMCSYDKDPQTGVVTFYGDLSGEFVLSKADQNLNFNSSVAEHCGFSKGTVDTKEELAEMLHLPMWHEKDGAGKEIMDRWIALADRADDRIPKLIAQMNFKGASGGRLGQINAQIKIITDLIRWWDQAYEMARQYTLSNGLPPKAQLEQMLRDLKRQRADIVRRGR